MERAHLLAARQRTRHQCLAVVVCACAGLVCRLVRRITWTMVGRRLMRLAPGTGPARAPLECLGAISAGAQAWLAESSIRFNARSAICPPVWRHKRLVLFTISRALATILQNRLKSQAAKERCDGFLSARLGNLCNGAHVTFFVFNERRA